MMSSPYKTSSSISQLNKLHQTPKSPQRMETPMEEICNEADLNRIDTMATAMNDTHYGNLGSQCPIHPNHVNLGHQELGDFFSQTNKFATLARETNELDHSRFRTMPHGRPVSTFTPNASRPFVSIGQEHQLQIADQQQLYSKLRLIYNANNNYNLCQPQDQHAKHSSLDNSATGFNNETAIGLAVLAQQQQQQANQKTFQAKRDSIYNGMHTGPNQLADSMMAQTNGQTNQQATEQLASFLIDCQQPRQQQIFNQLINHDNQQLINAAAVAGYGIVGQHSGGSAGASTSSSNQSNENNNNNNQQPTPSSESVMSNVTSSINSNSLSEQLISFHGLNSNNNKQTTFNPTKGMTTQNGQTAINTSQLSANNQTGQQATGNNEQSDYALPFPPKWV